MNLAPYCVGWYTLNETSGIEVYDASIYSGALGYTVADISTITVAGKLNGAFNFAGVLNKEVTIVELASTFPFRLNNKFSVVMWVKANVDPDEGSDMWVLEKKVSGGDVNFRFDWYGEGGAPPLRTSWYIKTNIVSYTGLVKDTWYMLVLTFDKDVSSGQMKAYKNNASLEDTYNNVGEITVGAGSLFLGGNGTLGYTFNGALDNVMIFNICLTPTQISWLYNKGAGRESLMDEFAGLVDDVQCQYKLNDDEASSDVIDEKGNYNGILKDTGVEINTDTISDTGLIGKCLNFVKDTNINGDFVSCGNIGLATEWSVSFHCRLDIDVHGHYYPIGTSHFKGISFYDGGSGRKILVDARYSNFTCNKAVVKETWYHIVIIRKRVNESVGELYYVFVDAELDRHHKLNDVMSCDYFKIGCRGYFLDSYVPTPWDGKIDNVVVFNRALYFDEVKYMYNNGVGREKIEVVEKLGIGSITMKSALEVADITTKSALEATSVSVKPSLEVADVTFS